MPAARPGVRDCAPEMVRELLSRGVPVRMRALGGSMRPFLRSGGWITLEPLRDAPRTGDVLAVERSGRLLAHRVVGVSAAGVLLRGDARRREDGVFATSEIVGRVRQPFAARLAARAWSALHPWPLRAESAARALVRGLRVLL